MRPALWHLTLSAYLAGVALAAHADEEGRQLFISVVPACALCHTLKDAGATGAVGPSLDELKPDAQRVAKAVRNGIGQMPAFPQLTEAQVQALARYVEEATRSSAPTAGEHRRPHQKMTDDIGSHCRNPGQRGCAALPSLPYPCTAKKKQAAIFDTSVERPTSGGIKFCRPSLATLRRKNPSGR